MKKIYIKPENIVVALHVRDNVMQIGSVQGTSGADNLKVDDSGSGTSGGSYDPDAREVIRSRGAWEEW